MRKEYFEVLLVPRQPDFVGLPLAQVIVVNIIPPACGCQNYIEQALEEMRDRFQFLAETMEVNHQRLTSEIKELKEELREEIQSVKEILGKKIDLIAGRLDHHDQHFEKMGVH